MQVVDLIRKTRHLSEPDLKRFHELRQDALVHAKEIYDSRSRSYGEPTDEFPYGSVSLADEIFKRAKRMSNMCDPTQGELGPQDLSRLEDAALDLINFCSWQYALIRIANGPVDRPRLVEKKP